MKKLLTTLILLALAGNALAGDGDTSTLEQGWVGIGFDLYSTSGYNYYHKIDEVNNIYNATAPSAMYVYIYGRYAGLIEVNLTADCSGNNYINGTNDRLQYLNFSKETNTAQWSNVNMDDIGLYCNSTTSVLEKRQANFSFWSNTGLFRIQTGGASSWLNIYYLESTIKYTTNQYIGGTYEAGVKTRIPVVTAYRPQKTSITTSPTWRTDETTNGSIYAGVKLEGYYFSDITPDCSLGNGSKYFTFVNRNTSDASQTQTYYTWVNISSKPELNITSFTYPAESTQLISALSSGIAWINLSVTASEPGLVEYVAWYIKNSNTSTDFSVQTSATNYSLNYPLTARPEPYYIVVQLLDTDCEDYPERGFWVYVGKYINLSVTVDGRVGTGIPYSLEGAEVRLNSTDLDFDFNEWTDINGTASFNGLYASNYTLTVSKADYSTYTSIPALELNYGGSNSIAYGKYVLLNYTGSGEETTIANLSCTSYSNKADIRCCVDTNLLNYWVTASSPLSEQSFNFDTQHQCFNFSDYMEVPCGTEYTIYIDGFRDTIEQTRYTKSCSATTTTTSTTTTTQVPISMHCDPIAGNDTYCCLTTTLDSPYVFFEVENESVSGAHIFNNTALGGTGFCFTLFENITDAYNYCDHLYEIWVIGYKDHTYNAVDSSFCTGGVPTTTTSTTTTTLIPPNCSLNSYDTNKNCVIDNNEQQNALNDFETFQISINCITSINYYWGNNITIPNCYTNIPNTSYTPPTYTTPNISCTNLTGKIQTGDLFHASTCAFILPLGVSWFYGLSLLFVAFLAYIATRTILVSGIVSLLWMSIYYMYLPQPAISILSIGLGLSIGLTLLGYFTEIRRTGQ